eukprot:1721655-Amphidinium_carterae.1
MTAFHLSQLLRCCSRGVLPGKLHFSEQTTEALQLLPWDAEVGVMHPWESLPMNKVLNYFPSQPPNAHIRSTTRDSAVRRAAMIVHYHFNPQPRCTMNSKLTSQRLTHGVVDHSLG